MSTQRKNAFGGENVKNPCNIFLQWKSDSYCFVFFDKNKQENVKIELPLKFLALKQLQNVKGWSDALNGQIISNEVEFLSKEELNVVCYHKNIKGENVKTTIAKGLYSNIKDAVVTSGARYHKSVYIMLEDGTLANLQLKGATVKEWNDFFNKNKNRITDEWIKISKVKEDKKGGIKFNVPVFEFDEILSKEDNTMADETFELINNYLKIYLKKDIKPEINENENIEIYEEL